MNRMVGVLAAAVCLVASSPAVAQEPSPAGSARMGEREGLYGRVGLDTGYMSLGVGDRDAGASGLGTGLNLQAGYMIVPNLALFGEFNYQAALGLSATNELGEDLKDSVLEDMSMSYLSIGPGAAYFLASDVFLQGSLLYSQVDLSLDGGEGEPLTGFGFRLGAGKDFRMSDRFLLGVGANFFYGILTQTIDTPLGKSERDGNAMAFGVTLSASYN